MADFKAMGGVPAENVKLVAQNATTVFLMVMTGEQAREVIFNTGGLA